MPFVRSAVVGLLTSALVPLASQAELSADTLRRKLVAAAMERADLPVRYDGAYVRMAYPGGDVPGGTGVCTDEIIRVYRRIGIDLQQRVHEDMQRAFTAYPTNWGLTRPDSNIDHRRVPNLQTFFRRHGETLPVSRDPRRYLPGDLVTWDLGAGVPHIGIVVDRRSREGARHQILHNIGAGPKVEDVLFAWRITGHFRYLPAE
ncbi:MAG TPA: DUF1287 domain-containing protein [Thermoanaerobaculia bacterium]|nr:DUF1287 domain-containing protein [Thermoanaerobaculia bacterium]